MPDLSDYGGLIWVIAALILFPLLVIGMGELSARLKRRGKAFASSIDLLRNVVLPLVSIYVIITFIGDVPQESLVVKLFITAGVIIGLVAAIGILNGVLFEGETGNQVPKLFIDLGRILVISIGIAMVLSLVWGYDLNNLITALGVSSIVLGLALQDTLGNLFNGITIINERPFQIGDYVEIDGHVGEVIEVNWRAVRLMTREEDMIVLPHLKVAQSAVINHSQPARHWAQKLVLGFSYENPPNVVKDTLMKTLLDTPGVLVEPEPEVKTDNYANSAVEYEIEYYIQSFGNREEIKDAFMSRVWYAARRAGLKIPFPQLNVHREPQEEAKTITTQQAAEDLAFALNFLDLDQELEPLSGHPDITELDFGFGEVLIQAGQHHPGLYFLLSGEVRMTCRDVDGDEVEMALLHRGDYFNEIIMRGRRINAVTVTATEDVRLIHFGEEVLRSLVNRYPVLANQLTQLTGVRRRQMEKLV